MTTVGQDLNGDEDAPTLTGCRRHLEGAFWDVLGRFRGGEKGAFESEKHGLAESGDAAEMGRPTSLQRNLIE